jgi:hypothetical protein
MATPELPLEDRVAILEKRLTNCRYQLWGLIAYLCWLAFYAGLTGR